MTCTANGTPEVHPSPTPSLKLWIISRKQRHGLRGARTTAVISSNLFSLFSGECVVSNKNLD